MGYESVKFPPNSIFLVTGGAGFIGSNICEAILTLGYKVRCLDDLSTGKKENIEMFSGNPDYEFIEGDIKDLKTCMDVCKGVDYVLHQAAWGSVPRSIEMPLFYCANNIIGTLNMLEAARQNKVKKFVYASSSSVYGEEREICYHHMLCQNVLMKNGQNNIQNIMAWRLMDYAISMYSEEDRIRTERMQLSFLNL